MSVSPLDYMKKVEITLPPLVSTSSSPPKRLSLVQSSTEPNESQIMVDSSTSEDSGSDSDTPLSRLSNLATMALSDSPKANPKRKVSFKKKSTPSEKSEKTKTYAQLINKLIDNNLVNLTFIENKTKLQGLIKITTKEFGTCSRFFVNDKVVKENFTFVRQKSDCSVTFEPIQKVPLKIRERTEMLIALKSYLETKLKNYQMSSHLLKKRGDKANKTTLNNECSKIIKAAKILAKKKQEVLTSKKLTPAKTQLLSSNSSSSSSSSSSSTSSISSLSRQVGPTPQSKQGAATIQPTPSQEQLAPSNEPLRKTSNPSSGQVSQSPPSSHSSSSSSSSRSSNLGSHLSLSPFSNSSDPLFSSPSHSSSASFFPKDPSALSKAFQSADLCSKAESWLILGKAKSALNPQRAIAFYNFGLEELSGKLLDAGALRLKYTLLVNKADAHKKLSQLQDAYDSFKSAYSVSKNLLWDNASMEALFENLSFLAQKLEHTEDLIVFTKEILENPSFSKQARPLFYEKIYSAYHKQSKYFECYRFFKSKISELVKQLPSTSEEMRVCNDYALSTLQAIKTAGGLSNHKGEVIDD